MQNFVTWDQACRRASGRRAFNAARQKKADQRRRGELTALIRAGLSGTERGVQRNFAQVFGVSAATVCRDMAAIFSLRTEAHGLRQLMTAVTAEQVAQGKPCPACGRAFPEVVTAQPATR
jgi:hypothetical protein